MDIGYGAPVAHPYEKWLLRRYAHRLIDVETRQGRSAPRVAIARWLIENRALVGGRSFPRKLVSQEGGRIDRATSDALAPARARLASAWREAAPAPSALERRIGAIGELLALSPTDHALFGALARSVLSRPLRDLIQRVEGLEGDDWYEEETCIGVLSTMLALPQPRLFSCVESAAPLALYGFVRDGGRGEVEITDRALSLLRGASGDAQALRRRLLGPCAKATLRWADFDHVEGRDIVERLIAAALETREKGVNILLYGAHGAGKTEFARALGARLGASAIFAGEVENLAERGEPSRARRIGDIALRRLLARQSGRAFVVVDEADDVFSGADAPGNWRRGSKAYVNRLVEAGETPTIWIVNDPEMLGPAILRRMTYALRFPAASRMVRARIVDRVARNSRVALDVAAKDALVALDAPPAIVAHALRTAQLARDSGAALACARASLRVLRGPQIMPAPQPFAYDAALARADIDLARLRDRVAASQTRALSFCFHGPPGTGKSAYARHLAEALELDVVEKRASDLLSKWLGETEKSIREAFEEAADRRAFLIFDEADSLLARREGATHGWEVTQVNEMLVCMERHHLPFACTTNAFQSLDPAALRRFLFKAAFLPMARAEVAQAFANAFATPAPAEALALDNLTPGDFAVVARKARVLGETDAMTLAGWLAQEVEAKPGARKRIGF